MIIIFKKNWELSFLNMTGGHFKRFFFAGSALGYAKKHFEDVPYIDLENEKRGIRVRLKAPKEHQWTLGMRQMGGGKL